MNVLPPPEQELEIDVMVYGGGSTSTRARGTGGIDIDHIRRDGAPRTIGHDEIIISQNGKWSGRIGGTRGSTYRCRCCIIRARPKPLIGRREFQDSMQSKTLAEAHFLSNCKIDSQGS